MIRKSSANKVVFFYAANNWISNEISAHAGIFRDEISMLFQRGVLQIVLCKYFRFYFRHHVTQNPVDRCVDKQSIQRNSFVDQKDQKKNEFAHSRWWSDVSSDHCSWIYSCIQNHYMSVDTVSLIRKFSTKPSCKLKNWMKLGTCLSLLLTRIFQPDFEDMNQLQNVRLFLHLLVPE